MDIEERLRTLSEKLGSRQPVDRVHGGEEAFKLLEDLQESIFNYQVCSRPDTLLSVNKINRRRDERLLEISGSNA